MTPASRTIDLDEPRVDLSHLKIAIAHDYCTQRGGAERVALALLNAFPGAPLITACYEPEATYSGFEGHDIRTSWINRVGRLRRDPRLALPVLAQTFSRMSAEDADVVICSSTGWAHGIRGPGKHIVYCHNPARWLYQREDYVRGRSMMGAALQPIAPALARWDRQAADRADAYLANSTVVAERIRTTYGIHAEVVPPPIGIDPDGPREPVPGIERGFWLTVSRARGYKNTDVVAHAVGTLDPSHRLVIAGSLPPQGAKELNALPGVTAVGRVSDAQLRWLYSNCRGVVSVAHEDFGLTPIEGNAFGAPAVVLRAGGFLDTLVEGETGVFVEAPTAAAVADTLATVPDFDPARIRRHALLYSHTMFAHRMRSVVQRVMSAELETGLSSVVDAERALAS